MIHRPPDARPGGQPHVRKTFPFRSLPEGPLSATSGSSWIRRQWSDDVSLNDLYRLELPFSYLQINLCNRQQPAQLQTFELSEDEAPRTNR